ncbi:hypothetical protein [Devosia aquimaris]|uniref:hypothetical protein n=1 Tax=Devosia aquimaris TaxID=2866214 RepID=UPI001CD12AA9|nr:hypothetical protein [Devosia sp. CJK-A8-3]
MPTLIRLVISLLFLVGLVYVGMFMLVAYVEPEPKPVTIRIPTRELLGEPATPGLGTPAPAVTAAPAAPANP